jgi:hypothetical protein
MSAVAILTIYCDDVCSICGSGCSHSFEMPVGRTLGAVRARARGEGWTKGRRDGDTVDYCPDHKR